MPIAHSSYLKDEGNCLKYDAEHCLFMVKYSSSQNQAVKYTVKSWRWEEQRYRIQSCLPLRKGGNVLLLYLLLWVGEVSPAGSLLTLKKKSLNYRVISDENYELSVACILTFTIFGAICGLFQMKKIQNHSLLPGNLLCIVPGILIYLGWLSLSSVITNPVYLRYINSVSS